MRLFSLLGNNGKPGRLPDSDVEITGLSADSRKIRPGFLFAAIPGTQQDGRDYIDDAIDAGAKAVLGPPNLRQDTRATDVAVITDSNPRRQLARMAARFYSAQPRTIAAITGTNGKTSVANFTQQFWTRLGHPAASLGTLGVCGPNLKGGPSLTTPDPVELHRTLSSLRQQGVNHLALEASSHGLEQYRLDGVQVTAAAFTNLTRDHLDYHGTMDKYRAAKRRLFIELLRDDGVAVLNAESPEYEGLRGIAEDRRQRVISYGLHTGNLCCLDAKPSADGWDLQIRAFDNTLSTKFPLPGDFQVTNMLCAAALIAACGDDVNAALQHVATLDGVPGRLELAAQMDNGASIYVDYAHTPDALDVVLKTLRPHVQNELAVVFGCGGDRDAGKRPEMARIAAQRADTVFVTDDNPRTEDAQHIRREVLAGCPDATEIGDRRAAIAAAMSDLSPGDVLLVAGKGHEEGQIVGDEVLPFHDATVIRELAGKSA